MSIKNRPSFWDPRNISNLNYVPNIAAAIAEAVKLTLKPAKKQKEEGNANLLIIIDPEKDFTPGGRLGVNGTFEDIERLGERIIEGTLSEHYTDAVITIDQHPEFHISSPTWWLDEFGNMIDATLPVMLTLIDNNPNDPVFEGLNVAGKKLGKVRPRLMKKHCIKYAEHLQATGQGSIWVFTPHCLQGTDGIQVNGALRELLTWFSVARKTDLSFLYKGHIAQVDWFGPFCPCMEVPGHPQGGWQTIYLDKIRDSKTTEIAGEAEDFCVKCGVDQVIEYYGNQPDVLKTIKFLGNCTSAIVPGGDAVKALHKNMSDNGVQVINHDAPFGN